MVSLADSLVASSSRPLSLRMRADLTARRQTYQGRTYWVVKEPVGLRYFRFQEEEFAVLNMMKAGISLNDIKEKFEKDFAPHKITFQDLQHFIGTLHRSGLVVSNSPGQGPQLKKRGDERNNKELLGKFTNVLAIRFKGIDPERLLNLIYPYTRWFFSKWFALAVVFQCVAALLLVAVQFDVFRSKLPAFESFFAGGLNWLWLGIILGVTKIFHEFGHGLLCKHFGGECHEMGVMFLVLTPCLYCNVSDSWMLPNKYHRAAIGAGGIYVELFLASAATFIWWFSEPGMLNFIALRVMFICSISTVLFNGNPLLRFDGYYILSDLIEIPNLRQKASKILQKTAGEYCLGLEMPDDPFLPQSNQFMFGMYTVAAVTYRWFIFASILFFLNQVFKPYGLQVVGQLIAGMGLYGLVIQPMWQLGKFLHVPGRMDQVKWHRFYITLAIVAGIIFSVVLIPLPRNVKCALHIQPRDAVTVYAEVPGQIAKVAQRPGAVVEANSLIVELVNPEMEREIRGIENEKKEYEIQLKTLRSRLSLEPELAREITSVEEMILTKTKELTERHEDYRRLKIEAPEAGTIISPPLRPAKPPAEGSLPTWSGSPFDARNEGVMLQPGDIVCQIADPNRLEAILAIDQADIDLVSTEQEAAIVLDSLTNRRLTGKITEISRREMQRPPPSLGSQAGGNLATRTDSAGVERPLNATYQATVPLDNSDGLIRSGFRGRAKIRAGYQTLGGRVWRYLTRTFHFYM